MRTIRVHAPGGPEALQLDEVPDATPQEGEVLIRTSVIGVNFHDLWTRLVGAETMPVTPGIEAVGTVAALGEGVEGFAVGDRVIGAPMFTYGAYAELVAVPAGYVVPLPETVADRDAACLTLNYGTAYAATYQSGRLAEGETVLIQAAAGGVGLAAVQLAKLRGARIVGTASASKHDFLREQGVSDVIDYRSTDWVAAVKERYPDGVDLVVDGVGEDNFAKSLDVVGYCGRVVAYGLASGLGGASETPADPEQTLGEAKVSLLELMGGSKGLIGSHFGAPPELFQKWMKWIVERCAAGDIRPHVDREVPLAQAAEAHLHIHERRNVGKVLLVP